MITGLLFIAGILLGLSNAVAGAGTLFLLPVYLLAGLSPLSAAMSSVAVAWPGAITSLIGYRKDLARVPRSYHFLIIPGIVGAGIGSWLLAHTPGGTFAAILPWLVLVSVAFFAFQPQLHEHIHRPARLRAASPFAILASILLPVGFYAGYFGAGFGFIVLAVLGFTKLKTIFQINATKNLFSLAVALTSTIIFTIYGDVAWHLAVWPLIGSLIGGFIGARLAHRLPPRLIRSVIITMGLIVVIALICF